MRGSTQEKYLEAKLQDITRTEGRDVTISDLYIEINYLIPGTEEISEKVEMAVILVYIPNVSQPCILSCSASCRDITQQNHRTSFCNSSRLSGVP